MAAKHKNGKIRLKNTSVNLREYIEIQILSFKYFHLLFSSGDCY